MKTNKLLKAILGVVAILTLAACSNTETGSSSNSESSSSDKEKVLVGIRGDSPKISYTDENGKFTGFEVEIFEALNEVLPKYQFEFVQTEFPSLFTSLQEGKLDIVSGSLRTSAEREENYIHTNKSYMFEPYRLVVLENSTDINAIADLDGKKVGVGEGSLQAKMLQDYMDETGAKIELVYLSAADYPSSLESGKINAVIAPAFALEVYNESFEDVSFKSVEDDIEKELGIEADANAYFFLAKGNEYLRDEVSKGIAELRTSGKLSEISKKYFTEDFTTKIDESKETD